MRIFTLLLLAIPMLACASSERGNAIVELPAQLLEIREAQYAGPVGRSIRDAAPAVIVARLNADGRVSHARLQWTSGSNVLDSAALRAVRRAQFTPGAQQVRIPVRFRLGDSEVVSRS